MTYSDHECGCSKQTGEGNIRWICRARICACTVWREGQNRSLESEVSPFSPVAFCQHAQHPFHRTQDRSVNEDWTLQGPGLP